MLIIYTKKNWTSINLVFIISKNRITALLCWTFQQVLQAKVAKHPAMSLARGAPYVVTDVIIKFQVYGRCKGDEPQGKPSADFKDQKERTVW